MKEERNLRLRQLVRKLNTVRRVQKQKLDILCNDIITAHATFINHLKGFQFAADFYEALLGASNLDELAAIAGEFFTENIRNCSAAIIFSTSASPQIYFYSKDSKLEDIPSHIGQALTAKMVEAVCQNSQVCCADDLCRMGFFAGPAVLKRISLSAIGLNNTGPATGMILLYRSSEKPLCDAEISMVSSVAKGLAKAVKTLQNAGHCDSIA